MKAAKLMRRITLVLAAVLLFPSGLLANNIRIIGTPEIAKKDKKMASITFTIAWDNSWKASKPANYDAAWIFVKCWDGDQWNHVYLADSGHTPGNKELTGYRVANREGTKTKLPMTYELGKSTVYKQWHVDPNEEAVTGNVGLFLYRKDSIGSGNIVVPGVSLLWNYADQGFVWDDDLVVKVFAIEMVYVPEGGFQLGATGTAGLNTWAFTTNGTTFGRPYFVKSEAPITCAANAIDTTLCTSGNLPPGTLPADFPKGYAAFYIMKYELTQEAYADFLNTLNQGQQDGRIYGNLNGMLVGGSTWNGNANALASRRYYIEVAQRYPFITFGVDANNNNKWNETTWVKRTIGGVTDSCEIGIDGQDLAMHMVRMSDLLAYADFAGLRPMTELEYEKACRGNQPAVADEFAWGTPTYIWFAQSFHGPVANYFTWNTKSYTNINRGDERVNPVYNCGLSRGTHSGWGSAQKVEWWSHPTVTDNNWRAYIGTYPAPLRVGCFADSATTRMMSGATYWGVMNMSDNVSELCISAGYPTTSTADAYIHGRQFKGHHGDGQLESNGDHNVAGWAMPTASFGSYTSGYYIPRGMYSYDYSSYTWTNLRPQAEVPTDFSNVNAIIYDYIDAGRVGARNLASHGIAVSAYTHGAFMAGIRCVRTAGAKK